MLINMLGYEQTPQGVVQEVLNLWPQAFQEYVTLLFSSGLPIVNCCYFQDKTRTTLTMDDLSAALAEYGINARKPEFYM